MTKGINFQVSGGNVSIGNVVQGEQNIHNDAPTVDAQLLHKQFTLLLSNIGEEAQRQNVADEDVRELQQRLGELEKLLLENAEEAEPIDSLLQQLKAHSEWALPIVKKLLGVVYPPLSQFL